MVLMKTLEEIERDTIIRIANEKQNQILDESVKPGVDCSQFVEEWNYFRSLRDGLEKEREN